MTKILSTIGPSSEGKNIEFFIRNSELLRLNLSHNDFNWHKKTIQKIKKINKDRLILVDIPGIKPRTLNKKSLNILKGQIVNFSFKKKGKDIIEISNPLPKSKKKNKFFYLSDGTFVFKNLGIKKNILSGISLQNFELKPKKGLNIPFSIYNNKSQEKLYFLFLKKISKLNIDGVGLSFIQSSKIISKIKKKYPNLIVISKIENYLGYENRKDIIKHSDSIMIDRGDLAAEVGAHKMFAYSDQIILESKKKGKPIIVATENLNSLILNSTPSKSDIVNLEYYLHKKVEFLMLSDETATSNNAKNTVSWLKNYLIKKKERKRPQEILKIEELVNKMENQTIVLFSKKGYFYEKIASSNIKKIVLFTENQKIAKIIKLKNNSISILTKFPKRNLNKFLHNNIKKNKSKIFKNSNYACLINVIFPRQNSRANSFSIIQNKDFQ